MPHADDYALLRIGLWRRGGWSHHGFEVIKQAAIFNFDGNGIIHLHEFVWVNIYSFYGASSRIKGQC